jgi:hypothetical protein
MARWSQDRFHMWMPPGRRLSRSHCCDSRCGGNENGTENDIKIECACATGAEVPRFGHDHLPVFHVPCRHTQYGGRPTRIPRYSMPSRTSKRSAFRRKELGRVQERLIYYVEIRRYRVEPSPNLEASRSSVSTEVADMGNGLLAELASFVESVAGTGAKRRENSETHASLL